MLIIPHCYEPISVHYNSSGAAAAAAAAGLTKFAEAAGKRMRKLKRTWSLKKSDISRNLRKYSAPGFPGTSGSKLAGSSGLGIRNGGARGSKRIGQGNLEIKNGDFVIGKECIVLLEEVFYEWYTTEETQSF